jgi:hypothetical protein
MMLAGGMAVAAGCGNRASGGTKNASAPASNAGSASDAQAPGTPAPMPPTTFEPMMYPCNGNPDPCCPIYEQGLDASAHAPMCWARIAACTRMGGTFDLTYQVCYPDAGVNADSASDATDAAEVKATTKGSDAGHARDAATELDGG